MKQYVNHVIKDVKLVKTLNLTVPIVKKTKKVNHYSDLVSVTNIYSTLTIHVLNVTHLVNLAKIVIQNIV